VVNIARHADIDPELAIRRANAKFEARFKNMEDAIERAGQSFKELSTDDLESYWQLAKQDERS
jgi:uncharacterized protein YabN with tetrapyrrole methylase and pyrophosphatase domain